MFHETRHGTIAIEENYALDGKAVISSEAYSAPVLKLRLPEWAKGATLMLNGKRTEVRLDEVGYISVCVPSSFTLEVSFPLAPVFVSANPNVRADAGRVALTLGPVVYCLEGVDNGERLNRICVSTDAVKSAKLAKDFHGLYSIELKGYRTVNDTRLYFPADECEENEVNLKFIPYFAFANRGRSDMLVWVRKK